MMERLGVLWCRWRHRGAINLNSRTYECPECFRLTFHCLAQGGDLTAGKNSATIENELGGGQAAQ